MASALQNINPQGAYFNRFLSLGYSYDQHLNETDITTLGMIISECLFAIGDPSYSFIKLPGLADYNLDLSIADTGCLLYAETTKQEGTTIVLASIPWLAEKREGIELTFKWLLAKSFENYLKKINPAHTWIYPIKIVDEKWLLERFPVLREKDVSFIESWISRESLSKYRILFDELQNQEETKELEPHKVSLTPLCTRASAFHRHFGEKSMSVIDSEFPAYLSIVENVLTSAPSILGRHPLRIL